MSRGETLLAWLIAVCIAGACMAQSYRAGQRDGRRQSYRHAAAYTERDHADQIKRLNGVWALREASAYQRGKESR